jgi:hypothetical protein
MERVTRDLGAKELDALAAEIAARRKDPITVVNELLARAGISTNT